MLFTNFVAITKEFFIDSEEIILDNKRNFQMPYYIKFPKYQRAISFSSPDENEIKNTVYIDVKKTESSLLAV